MTEYTKRNWLYRLAAWLDRLLRPELYDKLPKRYHHLRYRDAIDTFYSDLKRILHGSKREKG